MQHVGATRETLASKDSIVSRPLPRPRNPPLLFLMSKLLNRGPILSFIQLREREGRESGVDSRQHPPFDLVRWENVFFFFKEKGIYQEAYELLCTV